MEFVIDPPISTKILKMEQRVRWRDRLLLQEGIDQTSLVLDDGHVDDPEFSFLVIGDSGSGYHRGHHPQRQIAERMLEHRDECRFVLHTGDVIYLVGSSEYYPRNFIQPYREFLVGGDHPEQVAFDQMVFNQPFLPVPGNHDYYDLPRLYGFLAQIALPVRYLFQQRMDFDVGWHGSDQGNAYARAFLDYLKDVPTQAELKHHLDLHYTAIADHRRCLRYQPGLFTRLPNRYYTFRAGGIDFFALDSNTFNAPLPLPNTATGDQSRQQLEQQRMALERERQAGMEAVLRLDPAHPDQAEQLDDLYARLEQLAEVSRDIDKQLASNDATMTDVEQLEWLEQRLIESWNHGAVRGRILYFHHPPYVTEATKWSQSQTLAVRQRLRRVLDAVAEKVGDRLQGRAVVDLVVNGHAHCLESLRTQETGHGDRHTNWVICGGSGFSLRRQRSEGGEITEVQETGEIQTVATSQLFVGRSGQGFQRRRPYSFLRIDVKPGSPPTFVLRPYVSEWFQREWKEYAIAPFVIE